MQISAVSGATSASPEIMNDKTTNLCKFGAEISCVRNTSEPAGSPKTHSRSLIESIKMLFEKLKSIICGKNDSTGHLSKPVSSPQPGEAKSADLSRLSPAFPDGPDKPELFSAGDHKDIYSDYDFNLYLKQDNNYYPVSFAGEDQRIIHIGLPGEERITCIRNPDGTLKPAGKGVSDKTLTFNKTMNLYKQSEPDGKKTVFLRFDKAANELMKTDVSNITQLDSKVTQVSFRHFDIFVPGNAPSEVYIAAHGEQALFAKNTIPGSMSLSFYTEKGKALDGHMDDILKLAEGQFSATERHNAGERLEGYNITQGNEENIDYAALTKKTGNTLISMKKGESDTLSNVMKSVSDIFHDKKINLNLYMCRTSL